MPTAKATKASDKAQICRKLVVSLQKLYGKSLPRLELPVLETFLFAICLEDDPWDLAEAGYQNLLNSFFDLNEVRVCSVAELEQVLAPLSHADWKGLRIRSVLRYVYESNYSFEFEKFRRLTQEVAVRTMKKINDLSPFVRDYALQYLLGSHLVSLDESMLRAAKWLGLVPTSLDAAAAGEFLKPGLRKSEVSEFCHLLRCLATDARFRSRFQEPVEDSLDISGVPARLTELQSPPKPRKTEKSAKSSAGSGKSDKVSGTGSSKKSTAGPTKRKADSASRSMGAAKNSGQSAAKRTTDKSESRSSDSQSVGKSTSEKANQRDAARRSARKS